MPSTLYLITRKSEYPKKVGTVPSLRRAAERLGLSVELLAVDTLVLDDIASMQFERGSLLFRINTSKKASVIETMLVTLHPGVFTTIFHPKLMSISDHIHHELDLCEEIVQGLQIIPTIFVDETWVQMDTEALNDRVRKVDGFPLVLKTLGSSHGRGVLKVDTVAELQGLLRDTDFRPYGVIIRKYLADYRHYRLIVVDGTVVASIEYHKPADDFRTNATASPTVSVVEVASLPDELVQLAIDSTALRSSILGGVDILVDQSDQIGYLAEVNVPCYYGRAEGPTGIDISELLLHALLHKRGGGQSTNDIA